MFDTSNVEKIKNTTEAYGCFILCLHPNQRKVEQLVIKLQSLNVNIQDLVQSGLFIKVKLKLLLGY